MGSYGVVSAKALTGTMHGWEHTTRTLVGGCLTSCLRPGRADRVNTLLLDLKTVDSLRVIIAEAPRFPELGREWYEHEAASVIEGAASIRC